MFVTECRGNYHRPHGKVNPIRQGRRTDNGANMIVAKSVFDRFEDVSGEGGVVECDTAARAIHKWMFRTKLGSKLFRQAARRFVFWKVNSHCGSGILS
ncbi:hypothetical protein FMUAM8_42920 [Nocardia cyriacigeorgica]|nr:hypothetical protein FMUAM8_42920 [Nocardia cyriacigeorgica]